MSYRNNPYSSESDINRANQEIIIDCENYNNRGGVRVNNGSSNMSITSHNRNQSGTMANSSSVHTLFESNADNTNYRVVRSYREYAVQFINSDDSDPDSSDSDLTDATDASSNESEYKGNAFDVYGCQSESKSNSDYDIKKSKTVKSTSTSSSRTAYKNPTLSSVVNQTLINAGLENNINNQYDEIKKIKEENHKKYDTQLKLQKMILRVPETYDIPTHNKKIISQRILNATLVLMVIIATTLMALYIYLKINNGYSFPHLKDINDRNRTKIIFIALFMYLAVVLGSIGSALNWKSILVTYCIFCSLNALALGYLVYGIYDDAYNYSNLPFAWWDTYSSSTRRSIQDHFSCCGFKESLDGGEISSYCPKEAVVWSTPYETIYDNFLLMKKDACARELNATVVGNQKDKVILPTPVLDKVPTPTEDVNGNSTNDPSISKPTETTNTNTDTDDKTTSSSTTDNMESKSNGDENEDTTGKTKRAFEIEKEESIPVLNSPVHAKNIHNILSFNEIEEEDDLRDDKDISSIRVLNKRTWIQENKDQYQARVNSTNPDINFDKVNGNSNYTNFTPEESRAFAKANNLEGCEAKLKPYIHKNLVPIFYVLLVFFCLYIITIPVALVFLFKLRTIPSINEFE